VFDIGVTKLAIVGGIALIVIGPEKLPGLAKPWVRCWAAHAAMWPT